MKIAINGSHPQESNFENSVLESTDIGSSHCILSLETLKQTFSLKIILIMRLMILIETVFNEILDEMIFHIFR